MQTKTVFREGAVAVFMGRGQKKGHGFDRSGGLKSLRAAEPHKS